MNETIQVLLNRRSVRRYQPKQITEQELETILQAGMFAPSGHGSQPVRLVVIQRPEIIQQLSKMNAAILGTSSDPFYGAPTVVLVLADRSHPTWCEDGALVMGNLMNAAHAIGVDSCWINRARQEFDSPEGKKMLQDWGIQGDYAGIGHCLLGYRLGDYPKAAPRKADFVVYVR